MCIFFLFGNLFREPMFVQTFLDLRASCSSWTFWMTVGESHVVSFIRTINILLLISRVYRRGEYGEYLGVCGFPWGWQQFSYETIILLNN